MADEVEMIPVTGAEPPKADPLAKLAPPKLKPGLKLPPKPGLAAGVKLPTKPGATVSALRPGLKLPTQTALRPGIKLPQKPVIRKPGASVAAAPLPKPLTPVAAKPAAADPAPQTMRPVGVDAQGVGKLPTVSATTVDRGTAAPDTSAVPKPMEALKSVTQKLKGITQEIPQQAILHRTGIIAEGGATEMQREAAKHKTARISLSDAMGVAPVKEEAAPMKTIRIKRPINIPSATSTLTPPSAPAPAQAPEAAAPAAEPTITQRKTLKISRPGGTAVRPGGKFGVKRPTPPAAPAAAAEASAEDAVADIPDIPTNVSAFSAPTAAPASESPSWVWTLSAIVQFAACVAIGALAWFLYENSQLPTFCGGLGWGA